MKLNLNIFCRALALAALMAMCGCTTDRAAAQAGRSYRTIDTEPRRNTDLARRENEAGQAHLAVGDLEKAAAAFKRALTADVEFGPAHNNLGKVYFQQQDWYRAAWEFEYAAKLLPEHAGPRNNLGLVLERSGQLDRAVDQYRLAVGLKPTNVEYVGNLARALIRRGDRTDEVRRLLATIIAHDTRHDWLVWARRQQMLLP